MIDIHFHCLPGIDDGPRTWDAAVALCKAAGDEGTTMIVATPHVLRDPWLNEDAEERGALIAELNHRLGGEPLIVQGCEYYFSSDAAELWELGAEGPLVGLNGSSYLLVEFPALEVPRNAASVFHELIVQGVTPVIAHPERNLALTSKPDVLDRLVKLGAMTQVTAASVTGDFGRAAHVAALDLLERDLVHFIASDAHSTARRPPSLAAARAVIAGRWGDELVDVLFEHNPRPIADAQRKQHL